MRNRPTATDARTNARFGISAPSQRVSIELLGPALSHGSVTISRDEYRQLCRLYGFVPEKPNERPPEPAPLDPKASWKEESEHKARMNAWKAWKDPRPFHQAGADRNLMRHAEADGLRIVAWLAKHVPPGEDPLKTLVQMASQAGWDVDPVDVAWADGESEQEHEDAAATEESA
jgi:hypothetical protein